MFEELAKIFGPQPIGFEKDWPDFRIYAIRRHGDQMYGEFPYALHLAMVECVLAEGGFTEFHYQAAAWLHDVLEDTDAKLDQIYGDYGPLVTMLVYSVTGEGKNRKERNASIYEKLKKHPEGAILKVADRIANMSTCRSEMKRTGELGKIEMYLKEFDEFKANVMPLVQTDLNSRLLWERLESLTEDCIQMVKEFHAPKEEAKEELILDEKKREDTKSIPSLGEE